jgi:aminoglycoside phosphotransferase
MRHEQDRVIPKDASTRSVKPVLAVMRAQGADYAPVRRLDAGVWGAWLVQDGRGRLAILKCVWDSDWRLRIESARQVVEALHNQDAPVPRFLATGFDPEVGTWYVQERLEGNRVEELDPRLLGEVIAFSRLQADIGRNLPDVYNWSRQLDAWMAMRADDVIEVVRQYSRDGAELAERLAGVVEASRGRSLHTGDVVHGDFIATQLLAQGGALSGVVDWDAAGRGDRGQDLALLFYNIFAQADRRQRNVDAQVVETLGLHGVDLCGSDRFGWFLAYEILVAFAFVTEHNPRHVAWRTQLGLRVATAWAGLSE